jgi:hypothetical protein
MPSELIPPPRGEVVPETYVFAEMKFGQYPGELEYNATVDAMGC